MLAAKEHKHPRGHQVAPAARPRVVQHPRAVRWGRHPGEPPLGWVSCFQGHSCAANRPQASLLDFIDLVSSLQTDVGIEKHSYSSKVPLALKKQLRALGASDSSGRLTGLQFLYFRHIFQAFSAQGTR